MNIGPIIVKVIALLIAITFHEFAHAWTARKLGDYTAANYGRLSLNPKDHIDPIGTVLLPILLILMRSPVIFGWAKPVPVNSLRFKDPQIGMLLTSLSGPIMNLLVALVFSLLIKVLFLLGFQIEEFFYFLHITVMVNVFLAFFNFIPIPPLDGYNALINFLPIKIAFKVRSIEPYGFLIFIMLLYFNIIDRLVIGPSKIVLNFLL